MTDIPGLHDVVITDGDVLIDGNSVPYTMGAEVDTTFNHGGFAVVTLQILARSVQYGPPEPPAKPEMTQAEARDIFRRRNPAAFPEGSSA